MTISGALACLLYAIAALVWLFIVWLFIVIIVSLVIAVKKAFSTQHGQTKKTKSKIEQCFETSEHIL